VLEVQADVGPGRRREIQIKLTPHERRRLDGDKTRSINSQAYELYLRGPPFLVPAYGRGHTQEH